MENGFVVCTYDNSGLQVEIPYEMKPDDIDLKVTDAFDVNM